MKKILKENRGVAVEMAIAALAIAAAVSIIVVTCTLINASDYRLRNKNLVQETEMNAIAEDYVYAMTTGEIKAFNSKYSEVFKNYVADKIEESSNRRAEISSLPEDTEKQKEIKAKRWADFVEYRIPDYTIEIEDDHDITYENEQLVSDEVVSQTLHIYKYNSESSSLNVTVTLTQEGGEYRTVKYWK